MFLPATSKADFIFFQELIGERTSICRMIWSPGNVSALGRLHSSIVVNILSKTKCKQGSYTQYTAIVKHEIGGIFTARDRSGRPKTTTSAIDHIMLRKTGH